MVATRRLPKTSSRSVDTCLSNAAWGEAPAASTQHSIASISRRPRSSSRLTAYRVITAAVVAVAVVVAGGAGLSLGAGVGASTGAGVGLTSSG